MINLYSKINGKRPLLVRQDHMVIWDGFSLQKLGENSTENILTPKTSLLEYLGGLSTLLTRIFRIGVHHYIYFNDIHILFRKNRIESYDVNGHLVKTFSSFRGSRPLKVFFSKSGIYFGEYWSNKHREEVNIYRTEDGLNWSVVYTFNKGSIRHVHGIQFDEYRDIYLILTGDSDSESGIWGTNDFSEIWPIVSGGQNSRAVSFLVHENSYIVPMDSPLTKNYIMKYHHSSGSYVPVSTLKGSAFHSVKIQSLNFISTVTESSKVNRVESSDIYASADGERWYNIISLAKDCFPVSIQKITRYSEVVLFEELYLGEYLVGFGRSLSLVSEGLLLWRFKEIQEFLKIADDNA